MFSVSNKVALITGAGQGIGAALAKVLLKYNLKAVAIVDINEEKGNEVLKEIEGEFGCNRAVFIKADVSNASQFEQAFEITVGTFNQLDIVINNAAIIQEVNWEACIRVNLGGVILGSTLAMEKYLPKYKSDTEAVIINISSMAGINAYEILPVYTSTKFGVIGFSKCIGGPLHYEKSRVRVVAICPGGTDTDILDLTLEELQEPYLSKMTKVKKEVLFQSASAFAEHTVNIIENSSSASVWIIEDNMKREVTSKKLSE